MAIVAPSAWQVATWGHALADLPPATGPRHQRRPATLGHQAAAKRWRQPSFPQLQTSLDSFLEFYTFQHPHRGYRTKGRVPAEIFWGVIRERRHEEA